METFIKISTHHILNSHCRNAGSTPLLRHPPQFSSTWNRKAY